MGVESDIKLEAGQVVIEAYDLCLDSKERRRNNMGYRRAMVHDGNDGLTINWANDYPGGVTINRLKSLTGGKISATSYIGSSFFGGPTTMYFQAENLVLYNKNIHEESDGRGFNNVALSHQKGDKLVINKDESYKGGVEIESNVTVKENIFAKEIHPSKLTIGWDNPFTPSHEQYITMDRNSIIVHNLESKKLFSNASSGVGNLTFGNIASSLQPKSVDFDLLEEVIKLRKELDELKVKLENL